MLLGRLECVFKDGMALATTRRSRDRKAKCQPVFIDISREDKDQTEQRLQNLNFIRLCQAKKNEAVTETLEMLGSLKSGREGDND